MEYNWETHPSKVKDFIYNLKTDIQKIIGETFIGFYVHGSVAMGGG